MCAGYARTYVHMYMRVFVYLYVYAYVCISMNMYICMFANMYTHTVVYVYIHTYLYVCLCVYMCMYTHVCTCVYAAICAMTGGTPMEVGGRGRCLGVPTGPAADAIFWDLVTCKRWRVTRHISGLELNTSDRCQAYTVFGQSVANYLLQVHRPDGYLIRLTAQVLRCRCRPQCTAWARVCSRTSPALGGVRVGS